MKYSFALKYTQLFNGRQCGALMRAMMYACISWSTNSQVTDDLGRYDAHATSL